MTLSLLSHAVQIFGPGVPLSPAINSLFMTLAGFAAMTLWTSDAGQ